VVGSVISR